LYVSVLVVVASVADRLGFEYGINGHPKNVFAKLGKDVML
jgi:hypothetical protein